MICQPCLLPEVAAMRKTEQCRTKFPSVSFAHNQEVEFLATPGKLLGFQQQLQHCSVDTGL